jgi:hypothetical protein
MNDNYTHSIKGVFSIDTYKGEKLLESFSDNNLVVIGSRSAVASLVSGIKSPQPINRFSLGFKGHQQNINIFTPKEVGGEYTEDGKLLKFNEERTELFCEELNESTFDIKFYPISSSDESQKLSCLTFFDNTEIETQNTFVEIFTDCNSVTYKFTIEDGIGHGEDFKVYTEAGLYAGSVLFSLKTFTAKVKDESTKFVITWKIYF